MDLQKFIKLGTAYYKPKLVHWNYASTAIYVVGCGGTGGRLIPILAQHIMNHNLDIQLMRDTKVHLKHKLKLVLIDFDIVEQKNLKRQNFFQFDIGKNKAKCLAERYSALYGIDIEYSEKTFAETYENMIDRGSLSRNNIIFDCTDNLDARKSIESTSHDSVIISCGNEDVFGQVLIGNSGSSSLGETKDYLSKCLKIIDCAKSGESTYSQNKERITSLPTLLSLYPEFKDTVKPSCTEIALEVEQSMPINMLVAQLAYNAFYHIVGGVPLNYNMVRCNVNNAYTTSFISNILDLKNILIKAFCMEDSPEAEQAFNELQALFKGNLSYQMEPDKAIDIFKRYGKFSKGFLNLYLKRKSLSIADKIRLAELKKELGCE